MEVQMTPGSWLRMASSRSSHEIRDFLRSKRCVFLLQEIQNRLRGQIRIPVDFDIPDESGQIIQQKAEKKQACREKIPSAVAKRAKRHPHTLLNPDLRFGFFQNGLQLSECIDTDTKSISIFTRF